MLSLPLAEARSSAGLHGFGDVGRVGRLLCFLLAGFFVRFDGGAVVARVGGPWPSTESCCDMRPENCASRSSCREMMRSGESACRLTPASIRGQFTGSSGAQMAQTVGLV